MRKRIIRRAAAGAFLLVTCVMGTGKGQDLKRYETEAQSVTIVRDTWGVPHIYGKKDADVVFGLMYVECETDFNRVEKNYLEMLGRQAEAFGESYLTNDVMMRLIYDSVAAKADYAKSPVWMRRLLDAWADGINYYLYKHPETKPLALTHFEPWYPLMFTDGSVSATSTGGIKPEEIQKFYYGGDKVVEHTKRRIDPAIERMVLEDRGMATPSAVLQVASAGIPGVMAVGDGGGAGADARAAAGARIAAAAGARIAAAAGAGAGANGGAGTDAGANGVGDTDADAGADGGRNRLGPDGERDGGSNGFAVAPAKTKDGHAMLYINPHVPYYFRMEVQLVSDEGLNAYGAVTWGQFFIYQGFNAHCGWMHTSSYADVADLYAEKASRRGDGWVYEYEGEVRKVISKPFTVWYKKNGQLLSMPITGFYTHHGPVMASRDGKWLSLKEYNRSLGALIEAWQITKANTFAEYKTAMDIRANTTNNTVYADDKGNIAYWHGNYMPKRSEGYNWALPVDGSVAATEWKGLHTLEEIVHVYNPATGWIQNCNATPFTLSGSSSPDKNKYPGYMAPEGENFRGLNAERLFQNVSGLTIDSLIAKGYDKYLTAFDRLVPALAAAYDSAPDEHLREAVDVLRQWDRRAAEHSVATTLAVEWGSRIMMFAPKPKLSDDAPHPVDMLAAVLGTAGGAGLLKELGQTLKDLEARYGNWKIEWGEVCRYQRMTGKIVETYDDGAPSLPVGLVSSAFGALPSVQSRLMKDTRKRYAYSGNSFIAAVEFGPRLVAKTIVTGGESSDPKSPHFSDQAEMYLGGKFKDVRFYKEDVMKGAERTYHPGE